MLKHPASKYRAFAPMRPHGPHLARRGADPGPDLVQRRPARRQPGADRADGHRTASCACSRRWWRSASRKSRSVFPRLRRPSSTSSASSSTKTWMPDDVTIQVLTQAREPLIQRTFESLQGAKRVIVHLYNATAPVMRKVVLGMDEDGIVELATTPCAPVQRSAPRSSRKPQWTFQYSPEMFSGTELAFSQARGGCRHRGLGSPRRSTSASSTCLRR